MRTLERDDMPFCLTPSKSGGEDFTAPAGCVATVRLGVPDGCAAVILHIRYGKDPIDEAPPLQFQVTRGLKLLVVLVEASAPGVQLNLMEAADDGSQQIIDRFHYDPKNPARGYMILGA